MVRTLGGELIYKGDTNTGQVVFLQFVLSLYLFPIS